MSPRCFLYLIELILLFIYLPLIDMYHMAGFNANKERLILPSHTPAYTDLCLPCRCLLVCIFCQQTSSLIPFTCTSKQKANSICAPLMAVTNHCLTGPAISRVITLIDLSGSVLRHNYFRWLWRRQNDTDQCVLVLLFVDFDWLCLHWLWMWLLGQSLVGERYLRAADMLRPGLCKVIGSVDIRKTGTACKQKCAE